MIRGECCSEAGGGGGHIAEGRWSVATEGQTNRVRTKDRPLGHPGLPQDNLSKAENQSWTRVKNNCVLSSENSKAVIL